MSYVWVLEILRRYIDGTEEWVTWTTGSLEECLAELMVFRAGQAGDSSVQARLVSPVRELG